MTAVVSDYASRLEGINKMLQQIADRYTPLLNKVLVLGEPATALKHEWVDKTLVGFMDTLKTAMTTTTGTILTVSGGTNTPKRYIGGLSLLRFQGSDEILLVTSVITTVTNSAQLVVTRAYQSSTASTYSATQQLRIFGNPQTEGFTAGRDDSQKGVRRYNYTQIFERELILSGSSQVVDAVSKENRMDQQAANLTPELLKELESALIHGTQFASADLTTRAFGGMRYWATTYGTNQTVSGADVDFKMLDDVIEAYLSKGGDPMQLTMLVPVRQQRKINALKEARVVGGGQSQSDNSVNNFVTRYDFGSNAQVDIIWSNDLFPDEVYFFQKDKFKVKPLQDRQWDRVPLAKTGDTDREMLIGEYTLEVFNSTELLYRYYGLNTAA
jgi:hypothetical protein